MGKPAADFYIGNTCRNVQEWETQDCGSRKNHKIGIMHGRLSAPTDGKFQSYPKYTWKEEFSKAAECGLDLIEWIFEADEWEKNQFATQAGLEQIKRASKESGVAVDSICADYFMDLPLLRVSDEVRAERVKMLEFVIGQAGRLGAHFVELPFLERSAIENDAEADIVVTSLQQCLPLAMKSNVVMALETSLPPQRLKELLQKFEFHPNIGVNYDSGNTASLGFNQREEIRTYGSHIATVHVKDRMKGGGTVPLGTGDTDFPAIFEELSAVGYAGPFIFQAAREGHETKTAIKNIRFLKENLSLW